MGIRSFTEQNFDFEKSILGFTMSTFGGGRVAVHVRRKEIPISYVDAMSMYPSQFILQHSGGML